MWWPSSQAYFQILAIYTDREVQSWFSLCISGPLSDRRWAMAATVVETLFLGGQVPFLMSMDI